MPKLNNEELKSLYDKAESADKALFAEMRSNLLLIAGEHYSKNARRNFVTKLRNAENLSEDQKLRLTKNHIQKIAGTYVNNIISGSPNVTIVPDIDTEIQDQKAAELNLAVWRDATQKYKLKAKIRNFAENFIGIGEVCLKISWDPMGGKRTGFEPLMRKLEFPYQDEQGQFIEEEPVLDEQGQPKPDKTKPVFEGGFEFHTVYGFNLMRSPDAQSMDESPYLIERKMVDYSMLKKKYENDPIKMKYIEKSNEETFMVFDGSRNEYRTDSNQTLITEHYYRPSIVYPEGYYYIRTKEGILEEGELPYGIFPYVYKEFDAIPTSPRGRSKIRQARPYQIEINRCASAIATHQVTLGDDKLVTNTSGKIEHGGFLPGVRLVKVPGGASLTHLPGRSGDQYLPYMQSQIAELYQVLGIMEQSIDKEMNADPYVLLFQNIKQKKVFNTYIEKFEEFLVDTCELYLKLARHYLPDEMLIPAIGKREQVNIAEFRSMEALGYKIKIEPMNDNIETMFGKQLALNHTLQYVGGQLGQEQIGSLLKNSPFGNADETFDDLTIDYENVKNDMLALERGEYAPANQYDNHVYVIKKLAHRMKLSDFRFLDPQIQEMFQAKIKEHEEAEANNQRQLQLAQAGQIPTDGYMVKVDFYVSTDDGKTKRAVLPYSAVSWLLEKLEAQGANQQNLESMQDGALAELSEKVGNPDQATNGQSDPNQG